MRQVMNGPCGEQFGEGHGTQCRMDSAAFQVGGLQVQGIEISQILFAQGREIVKQMIQRFVLTDSGLGETVERIEGAGFAGIEDEADARHPIRMLSSDQVANDFVRTPSACAFITVGPALGKSAEQGVDGGGGAGEQFESVGERKWLRG